MDPRRLRAFVTVVDHGGISSAAERLGYVQSSISAQLRSLEHELGTTLLRRTPTGATPTEAGLRLLPYARQALELEERMRAAVAGARPVVRIGALETLASEWLPDVLVALDHETGGLRDAVEITLTVASRGQLSHAVANGELDVVFVFDNDRPAAGPKRVVGRDAVVLVASPEHPLSRRTTVTADDLAGTSFLIAEPGCTSQMLFDRLGRDLAAQAPVGMVTGSLAALRRMATHGLGVALLPALTAARDVEAGDLVVLPVDAPAASIGIEGRWRAQAGPVGPLVQRLLCVAQRHSPVPLHDRQPEALEPAVGQ